MKLFHAVVSSDTPSHAALNPVEQVPPIAAVKHAIAEAPPHRLGSNVVFNPREKAPGDPAPYENRNSANKILINIDTISRHEGIDAGGNICNIGVVHRPANIAKRN